MNPVGELHEPGCVRVCTFLRKVLPLTLASMPGTSQIHGPEVCCQELPCQIPSMKKLCLFCCCRVRVAIRYLLGSLKYV